MAAALLLVWIAVLLGLPRYLPTQAASWLTFLALFITPGYLLGDLLVQRLRLDLLDRLALAFPLGIAVMAIPGMFVLLQHWTLTELTNGWLAATTLVLIGWLIHIILVLGNRACLPVSGDRWTRDEIVMLAALGAAFLIILPTLTLYKIDGDAYAVGSFTAEALAGLPLNATEPLFGTDLWPGVRMAFNQSLPMAYLWSALSGIAPLTLTAVASRPMIALWALLAAYMLGKAAGEGTLGSRSGRRMGLFLVAIQLIIYLASPFLRGDNVSLFFFERTTADKFMVPVTLLPVVFALAILYLRRGQKGAWLAAAIAAFAVSTIHPLIAAMLALALAAFGGFHLLLNLRTRRAIRRSVLLWMLIAFAMFLPFVQLYLSRGEAPLAASYPSSLDGWTVDHKLTPVLPFVHLPSLDVYGPLPNLAQLDATQANTATDPFLIWRFAVNMNRRRLVLFDLDHYISDPNILLEPPYLLALLMLPLLLWGIRRSLGAQFALSTTLAVIFVMFNPLVTPLIGSFVMPWILWRFVWLVPFALIIALSLARLATWIARLLAPLFASNRTSSQQAALRLARYAPLTMILLTALLLSPFIARNLRTLADRAAFPYFYPTPANILNKLDELTTAHGAATVMANQDLSVTIPAYVARAHVVAHRVPTTSEIFPADRQDEALQRLIDQHRFFRMRYLTDDALAILERYDAGYIVASSGSNLDLQLRLAPQWFEWVLDDQSLSLYAVRDLSAASAAVQGNSALAERLWPVAARHYRTALEGDKDNLLALFGLAEIAHVQGRFDEAVSLLESAITRIEPENRHAPAALNYRLGQIYAELGDSEQSIRAFDHAQQSAPQVSRFHLAMGDACLKVGRVACAEEQYAAAVANENLADVNTRRIALADIWRQRGEDDRALHLYEEAVAERPNLGNQLMLASAYREAGSVQQADALLELMRAQRPFSAEVLSMAASVDAVAGDYSESVARLEQSIRLLDMQGKESINEHLALAQALIESGQLAEAGHELDHVLHLEPSNANAYHLKGDLHSARQEMVDAALAYQRSFRLDPTQVGLYLVLSDQLRREGGRQDDILELLSAAIAANPDEATLALALGDHLQREGDTEQAIEVYQSALDMFEYNTLDNTLNPGASEISRAYAYARLAGLTEDRGQLESAMNYYSAAVAAAPHLPWTQVMVGDARMRRNDVERAEAAYRRALAEDPSYIEGYVRLADLHYARGDTVEALTLQQQALQTALSQADWTPPRRQAGLGKALLQDEIADPTAASDEDQEPESPNFDEHQTQLKPLRPSTPGELSEDAGNSIRLLARLYQANGQTSEAIVFYEDQLAQGTQNGWFPAELAQFHKGLGDIYLAENQPEVAEPAFSEAVRLDAWWPQARLGWARALADLGETESALVQLRNVVELAPGYVEAQVALADALEQDGAFDEALEIYESTAAAHAGNARATLALARARLTRGRLDAAEQSYRKTIAMNAGNVDAYVGLAALLIDAARYDEAEQLLTTARTIDQRDANLHLQAGILAQRQGKPDAALASYRQAAELGGESISLVLIDLMQRYANYEATLSYLQQSLRERPDDLELLLRLARVQRQLGRYSESLAALLDAAQLEYADSRLSAELGELYLAQGRPQAALAAYRQAVNAQDDEYAYYLTVSELWRGQGEFDEAAAVLEQGIEFARQPGPLYVALSALHAQRGENLSARQILEQGIEAVGEEDVQLMLAMAAYHELPDARRAEGDDERDDAQIIWVEELLARMPNEPAVRVALGNLYLQNDRADEGIDLLEEAVEMDPTDAAYFLALADAYADEKDSQAAIMEYLQALVLDPTLVEAYIGLAEQYAAQQDWANAALVFEQGRAVAPTSGALLVAYAAHLLERDEDERANELLASVDQLAPTAATLAARAALFDDMRRDDDALRDLEAALRKEPGSVETMLALGDYYRGNGRARKARDIYQDAIQTLPGVAAARIRLNELTR